MCSTFTMHPISIYIYINMYMCVYMYRYKVTFHHMAGSFPQFRPPHPVLPGTWSSARWRGEGTADWAQWGGGREGSEGSGGTRATEISNMPWFDMICLYNICVLFLIVSCVSLNRYTYIFWSRYILSCILKVLCTKQTTYLYTLTIHCFQLYLSTYVLIVRKDMFYPSCCDPDWHCSETRLRQAYQVASVVGKCPVVIYSGFEIVKSFQWTHKNIMWVKQCHLHHPPEKNHHKVIGGINLPFPVMGCKNDIVLPHPP